MSPVVHRVIATGDGRNLSPEEMTSSFFVNKSFNESYENHQDSFILVVDNCSTKATIQDPQVLTMSTTSNDVPIEPSISPNVYRSDPHCAVQPTADLSSSPRRTDNSFYAAPFISSTRLMPYEILLFGFPAYFPSCHCPTFRFLRLDLFVRFHPLSNHEPLFSSSNEFLSPRYLSQ